MPQVDPLSCRCACGESPRSLAQLRALGPVEELGQTAETLALLGTTFEDALFSTRNQAALITGQGGLGRLQTTEHPFRVHGRRVTLRVSPHAPVSLARTEADEVRQLPGSLVCIDAGGVIHHRVQYLIEADRHIAQSLEPEPVLFHSHEPQARPANILCLASIRQARETWGSRDAATELNGLIENSGQERLTLLRHVQSHRAWPVHLHVLPSFLSFLCDHRIVLAPAVIAKGLLQASLCRFENVQRFDQVMIFQGGRTSLTLALDQLNAAWIVATPRFWHLELFTRDGTPAVMLALDPMGNRQDWNSLLLSLPPE